MYLRPASRAQRYRVGERHLAAHAGQLDEDRQVDAGDHFHVRLVHDGYGEVGGRAAEHVGEDDHPVAGIGAMDGVDDLAAAHGGVVFRPDGDRLELRLRPHHVLERRAELERQPAMRDDDKSDHEVKPTSSLARFTAKRGLDRGDR